ncbi:hypothetical protein LCGC14_3103320 [marine sediment metagenome]|uniref:Uncharacterized protein n=1 Tax=marine sediment metagenome TaxID=412755 RepID=A0A0F8YX61_9ZZZZ
MKQESVEERPTLRVEIGGVTTTYSDECLTCLMGLEEPFIFWEAYGEGA